MHDCVTHQVADHRGDHARGCHDDAGIRLDGQTQVHAALPRQVAVAVDDFAHDLPEMASLRRRGAALPGEEQQGVDELPHACHRAPHPSQALTGVPGQIRIGQNEIDGPANRGERRTQLVADVARECLLTGIRRNRAILQLPDSAFPDPRAPLDHQVVPTQAVVNRPDLVVIVEESPGAHYVASLGGEPVAGMIDGWRHRSLWFDRLFATGTRSARGLEAVVAGFPPARAASVLRLEGAQQGFFTFARALRDVGYDTTFTRRAHCHHHGGGR